MERNVWEVTGDSEEEVGGDVERPVPKLSQTKTLKQFMLHTSLPPSRPVSFSPGSRSRGEGRITGKERRGCGRCGEDRTSTAPDGNVLNSSWYFIPSSRPSYKARLLSSDHA